MLIVLARSVKVNILIVSLSYPKKYLLNLGIMRNHQFRAKHRLNYLFDVPARPNKALQTVHPTELLASSTQFLPAIALPETLSVFPI